MTKAQRKQAKLLLTLACLLWVAGSGWMLFADLPDDAVLHHASPEVKERMRDCTGSFKQRYDCKEAIVIETGRLTFWSMTGRLALVTVPAILAGLLGRAVLRRIPDDKPPPPPEDTDWKRRAQAHIQHPRDDHHGHHPQAPGPHSSGQS